MFQLRHVLIARFSHICWRGLLSASRASFHHQPRRIVAWKPSLLEESLRVWSQGTLVSRTQRTIFGQRQIGSFLVHQVTTFMGVINRLLCGGAQFSLGDCLFDLLQIRVFHCCNPRAQCFSAGFFEPRVAAQRLQVDSPAHVSIRRRSLNHGVLLAHLRVKRIRLGRSGCAYILLSSV